VKFLPCFLLVLILFVPPSRAAEVALEGSFVQGGLVIGQAPAGAAVEFDGRDLRISEAGRFIFAFGRDAPPQATLRITYADGRSEERSLSIAKREYAIQRIDGLPESKVSPPEEVWARIKRENAVIAELRKADRPAPDFESGFTWPAIGPISGVYGSQRVLNGKPKRPHYGVDVAAPEGTPVRAPADGVVVLAEADLYYTGGTVILDHGHGLSSAFLHMKDVSAEVGDRLRQGDVLGTLGGTGRATGPHLDWRMNWFNRRIDPQLLVGPMPGQ
jgi:murein DD-endopeptidase MepM/ murein hydrolase activator NlpD